ncbi:hypothetical protein [Marinobacter changyiensis]|uniref:hypothetical protein n=1 Tax=Marinobacter changyiensis TaxID=2604091 RepID=UPI001263F67E|nr:hypothetical protein [Marinobacter changyiensis]
MIKKAKLTRGDSAKLAELSSAFDTAVANATALHLEVMNGAFKAKKHTHIIDSSSGASPYGEEVKLDREECI